LTEALGVIRKGKTDSKISVGTPVLAVAYSASGDAVRHLALVERDLKAAVRADALTIQAGDLGAAITLKPAEA
jgi:hypothetical protein